MQEDAYETILEDTGPLVRAREQDLQFVLKQIERQLGQKLFEELPANLPTLPRSKVLARLNNNAWKRFAQNGW